MKMILAQAAKKILGQKFYNDLRAKYLFRDKESPFPLFQETPFSMDWKSYNKPPSHRNSIKMTYIVSPTQRSGTNYLSHMLDLHPELEFPSGDDLPDEQCLYTYSENIKNYAYQTVSTWNKWIKSGDKKLIEHSIGLTQSMGYGLLDYFSQFIKPGSSLLFKTPDAGRLQNIFHMFPSCKVVILIRDGRDTLESFSKSWGGDGAFKKMCERWSHRVDNIMEFIRMAEASDMSDRVLIVRYDEVNDNTREELVKIFNFIEADNDKFPWDKLEDVPVLGSSSHKTKSDEVHWNPVKKSDNFKPNQKWVSWSVKRKRIFKKYAGENLIKLGFEEDNNW
ncbi:sulfotransferase [Fulvivirga sp. RKSG066]|uniref:sulfotransferase family protein n=1 Tax=Fulvivirga aurantia TaxID=2529383 RepID=UPI0012BB5114|nr:sulfotransferase [Fulvivirga aurantia]MTI20829.1 sulfotransferase [Fulvivirga aurantia]